MSRRQEEQFEQDRLGNVNRKIDRLRAQEGMSEDDGGIVNIGSADTGSPVLVHSLPAHTDQAIVTELHAYNETGIDGTYSLFEVEVDETGSITSTTRRSVPIEVVGEATRINSYEGLPFEGHIAVESDFEGHVGVGLVSDHKQENETTAQE